MSQKDDLISRQAALGVVFPYCQDDDGTCSKNGDDLRNLLDDIENLPSAQTEIIACGQGELVQDGLRLVQDCIDRQAAIDALEKVSELFPYRVPGNRDSYDQYNEAWNDAIGRAEIEIETLQSAQPEQRWIPSGEKPPKEGNYLVWMPFAPPKHRMAVAEYCGGYWNIKTQISAWMPLPAPYLKEGEK